VGLGQKASFLPKVVRSPIYAACARKNRWIRPRTMRPMIVSGPMALVPPRDSALARASSTLGLRNSAQSGSCDPSSFFVLGDHPLDDFLSAGTSDTSGTVQLLPEFASGVDSGGNVLTFADRAVPADIGVLIGSKPLVTAAVLAARWEQIRQGNGEVLPSPGPKSISRPSSHRSSVGLSDFFVSAGCGVFLPSPRPAPRQSRRRTSSPESARSRCPRGL
jgi:hypothetical protein